MRDIVIRKWERFSKKSLQIDFVDLNEGYLLEITTEIYFKDQFGVWFLTYKDQFLSIGSTADFGLIKTSFFQK